jgi:hypothetical protein
MQTPNTKIYLIISGALIVLFILIIILPFSKKTGNQPGNTNNLLTPTTVQTNPSLGTNNQSSIVIPADFTGAAEEELPTQVIEASAEKKDLRDKVPLDLTTFSIDFDYGQDRFIVTLKDPKDQAQKEFDNWRTNNYPGIAANQFIFK